MICLHRAPVTIWELIRSLFAAGILQHSCSREYNQSNWPGSSQHHHYAPSLPPAATNCRYAAVAFESIWRKKGQGAGSGLPASAMWVHGLANPGTLSLLTHTLIAVSQLPNGAFIIRLWWVVALGAAEDEVSPVRLSRSSLSAWTVKTWKVFLFFPLKEMDVLFPESDYEW